MKTIHGLEPCPQTVGYNSHGYWSTLKDIVEIEAERENFPFTDFPDDLLATYGEAPAIWVTTDPYAAFVYAISADEYNEPRDVIKARYPSWRDEIETIDCAGGMKVIDTDDGDDGYLIIDLRPKHIKNL